MMKETREARVEWKESKGEAERLLTRVEGTR
jgi:hypothetical protein